MFVPKFNSSISYDGSCTGILKLKTRDGDFSSFFKKTKTIRFYYEQISKECKKDKDEKESRNRTKHFRNATYLHQTRIKCKLSKKLLL